MRLTPAQYTFAVFGGQAEVAKIVARHRQSVHRWALSAADKGLDGRIPSKCQQVLLEVAAERGIDLTADDLIRGREVEDSMASLVLGALKLKAVG